jgi:hypothetical protein
MANLKEKALKLYDLEKQKEQIEEFLKDTNEKIRTAQAELLNEMTDAGLSEFKEETTGKKFVVTEIINVKKTEYADLKSSSFMQAFKRRGFGGIFKYTVHPQTLKATITKEIMQVDDLGNKILPKWAEKYIQVDSYYTVKIKS